MDTRQNGLQIAVFIDFENVALSAEASLGDLEVSAIMDLLRTRGIMLEICPTSNWLTSSVRSVAEHPIRRLFDAGVPICINSDDPNLMGIDLVHEYALCAEHHGFDVAELAATNRHALEASFLDDGAKRDARKLMEAG
jgi:adenosine deaminase